MQFNPNLYPPLGWVYTDSDGVKHSASDRASLAEKVYRYRVQNHRPLGNAEQDITDQICSQFPHYCSHGTSGPIQNKKQVEEFTLRVIGWLVGVKGRTPIRFVSHETAKVRAGICSRCPMQKGWQGTCSVCMDDANMLSTILRNGNEIPDTMALKGCAVVGSDLRLDTVLEQNRDNTPTLPEFCWKLKL